MSKIVRVTGEREVRRYVAGGTIAAGDSVQYDEGGKVVVGATNNEILGIALEASSLNNQIDVDVAHPGDIFRFPIEAGTMAAAKVGTEVDLESADGVDVDDSTNDDVMIVGWNGVDTTSGSIDGTFRILASSAGIK
jgi:hypothetical protein